MARAEVHIWVIDVDDESAVHQALGCLPAAERDRLGARAQPHRRRALCANAALRILTAAASTGALPLPELAPDSRGQQVLHAWARGPLPGLYGGAPTSRPRQEDRLPPGLPGGTAMHRIHVSLSHAGRYAAVALSTAGPVGVDIEETEPMPDRERFARGILAGAERSDWAALPGNARDTAVIRAFTRKEALLKALGVGLAGGLREVITGLGPGPARLRALPQVPARPAPGPSRTSTRRPAWPAPSRCAPPGPLSTATAPPSPPCCARPSPAHPRHPGPPRP